MIGYQISKKTDYYSNKRFGISLFVIFALLLKKLQDHHKNRNDKRGVKEY